MASDNVCGVGGGGNFPAPGDPPLNGSAITARGVFAGIAVSWTYPGTNAHSVAHTILYRGLSEDPGSARELAIVNGNYFFDNEDLEVGTRYYYWIRLVSAVSGNTGELIGPASAMMMPTVAQIIDMLVGRVNSDLLDTQLSQNIDRIVDVSSSLSDEEQNRLFGDNVLSQLLAGLADDLEAVDTLVYQETLERITANQALVARVDLILAQFDDSAAAILQEQVVLAEADRALALQIDTLQAAVGDDLVSLQTYQIVEAKVNELDDKLTDIRAEWSVRIDNNGWIAGLALRSWTLRPEDEEWTGDYDEVYSSFTILADRFAIAVPYDPRVSSNADEYVVPFVIDRVNGEYQIALNATALIPDGRITNAMVSNVISSDNFQFEDVAQGRPGSGWALFKDLGGYEDETTGEWVPGYGAYAEFNNVKVRGDLEATSIRAESISIINTKDLVDDAVTVPAATSGGNMGSVPSGSWKQLGSVTCYWQGNPPSTVVVTGSVYFAPTQGGNDTRALQVRIEGGGHSIDAQIDMEQGRAATVMCMGMFEGITADTSFRIHCKAGNSNVWDVGNFTLAVLGAKK